MQVIFNHIIGYLEFIDYAINQIAYLLQYYIEKYIISNPKYQVYAGIVSEWVIKTFNKLTFYFEIDIELYDFHTNLIALFYIILLFIIIVRLKRLVIPKKQKNKLKRKELTEEEIENYKLEMERYEKELIEKEAEGGKKLDKKLNFFKYSYYIFILIILSIFIYKVVGNFVGVISTI